MSEPRAKSPSGPLTSKPLAGCRIHILRSNVPSRDAGLDQVGSKLTTLGAQITQNVQRGFRHLLTHVVTTQKMCEASLLRSSWLREVAKAGKCVVSPEWVEECARQRSPVPEAAYLLWIFPTAGTADSIDPTHAISSKSPDTASPITPGETVQSTLEKSQHATPSHSGQLPSSNAFSQDPGDSRQAVPQQALEAPPGNSLQAASGNNWYATPETSPRAALEQAVDTAPGNMLEAAAANPPQAAPPKPLGGCRVCCVGPPFRPHPEISQMVRELGGFYGENGDDIDGITHVIVSPSPIAWEEQNLAKIWGFVWKKASIVLPEWLLRCKVENKKVAKYEEHVALPEPADL